MRNDIDLDKRRAATADQASPQLDDIAHRETWLQIPWYVNDRIDSSLRARLDVHLQNCGPCREELARQRQIHAAMSADTGVDVLPSASLQRLRQRLDAAAAPAATPGTEVMAAGMSATGVRAVEMQAGGTPGAAAPVTDARGAGAPAVRDASWRWLAAAAVVLVLGLALFATRTPLPPAAYHTVSDAGERAPREVLRVVFTPQTTVERLQFLLGQAKAQIVAGPTEAGVYSLAMTEGQPVAVALAQLRRQPEVRFAEATVPLPRDDGARDDGMRAGAAADGGAHSGDAPDEGAPDRGTFGGNAADARARRDGTRGAPDGGR